MGRMAELPTNGIFIALFLRTDPPQPDDFHWALIISTTDAQARAINYKFHISGSNGRWMPDHQRTANFLNSFLLAGCLHIGTFRITDKDILERLITADDQLVNSFLPPYNCVQYILNAISRVAAGGYLQLASIEALKQEALQFGNTNSSSAIRNEQPRPIGVSATCT
ncbi:hypothetical protein BT69DRAFT_1239107 [Atractiella rhizophila]|nr:hypothetical protein BT69DRAFT_1239107 [Atractiella rhizophila]